MITKEGIIIKTIKYQESSKIAYILSEDGLTSYLIRNANNYKSKNYSYSQELTKIAFDISGRGNLKIVTSGKVINNYTNIKLNSDKIINTASILETIYVLSEHVTDSKILYKFLNEILDRINDSHNYKYYNLIFRIKILYLLGIAPRLSTCGICNTRLDLYSFDLVSGISRCKKCHISTETMIRGESYEVMRFLYLTKIEFLNDEVLDKLPDCYNEIDKFIDKYYDYYLGYHNRLQKLLNKISIKNE